MAGPDEYLTEVRYCQSSSADLSPLEPLIRAEDRSSLSSSNTRGRAVQRSLHDSTRVWGVLLLRLSPIKQRDPLTNLPALLSSHDCVATRYRFPASERCHAV
jgi:hypothetical protein